MWKECPSSSLTTQSGKAIRYKRRVELFVELVPSECMVLWQRKTGPVLGGIARSMSSKVQTVYMDSNPSLTRLGISSLRVTGNADVTVVAGGRDLRGARHDR